MQLESKVSKARKVPRERKVRKVPKDQLLLAHQVLKGPWASEDKMVPQASKVSKARKVLQVGLVDRSASRV